MRKYVFTALLALFALAACTKHDDSCIEDILKRLDNLESITEALDQKIIDGALIKSVTPISGTPGGWKIEFTGGTPSSIDILNGTNGTPGAPGEPGTPGDTFIYDINENADGTITIILNDGPPRTEYVFERASAAVRFEVFTFSYTNVAVGNTVDITFVANPSTAWIPTIGDGDMTKWTLNGISTRASYATPSENFSLVSINKDGDKDGQYIAKIKFDAATSGKTDYLLSLVLNTGSATAPVLVSSPAFTVGTGTGGSTITPPELTPGRITIKTNPSMLEHLIYMNGSGNVEINWGDGSAAEVFPLIALASNGTMNSGASAQFRHTYAAAGERTITITGYITGISSGADDDRYTELKINEMPNLQYLVFYFQLLTGLDVSNNPKLRYMKLDVNDFHSLDVSALPLLESLEISSSENLTALDVSNNPKLTRLSVGFTGITSLDVSNNPLLESLNYSGCSDLVSKPSLSNNPLLESVSSNSNTHLPPPDLSANPVVGNLDIRYCDLTAAQLVSILTLFAGRDGSDKWLYSNGRIYLTGNTGVNGTGYAAAKAAAVAAGWSITDL